MKNLFLFALLALGACATQPQAPTVPEKPIDFLGALLARPAEDFPKVGWLVEYDLALTAILADAKLPAIPCGDARRFFRALAMAESGLDRTQVYKEPAPLNNNSIGLLQLSLSDQKNYSLNCEWKTEEDVKHPIKNLLCGALILTRLHLKRPAENLYQAGGRYWSVLRAKKHWPSEKGYAGYERFKKAMACEGMP